jgi:hypothetical protein
VEVDGNLLPPNIVNKLNIFMVNVLRFKGSNDLSGLIDKAGSHNRRFNIYGDENGNGNDNGSGHNRTERKAELAGACAGCTEDCDGCA